MRSPFHLLGLASALLITTTTTFHFNAPRFNPSHLYASTLPSNPSSLQPMAPPFKPHTNPPPPLTPFGHYSALLNRSPFLTKSVTAAVVGALGDVLAQSLTPKTPFKPLRTASFALEGLLVSGPVISLSYAFLEDRFPTETGSPREKLHNAFKQLLVDNFIIDAFFVLSSFVTTGLLQGMKLEVIGKELMQHFAASWLACLSTNASLAPVEFTLGEIRRGAKRRPYLMSDDSSRHLTSLRAARTNPPL